MRTSLLLLTIIAISLASTSMRRKFDDFRQTYAKVYASQDETEHRFRIFQDNMVKSERLSKANPSASFGINKFSDLSEAEFKARYLMSVDFKNYQRPATLNTAVHRPAQVKACNPDATNYDWNNCGVITSVYNQGSCGSCWAFSATETIESYFALAGNQLTNLAMEQIVDCDTAGQDEGCNGGFPTGAYEYVESAPGLEPLSDYPYTAEGGESGSCNFAASEAVATVSNYWSINGETGMYQQLSQSSGGPVSVCVDASSWQTYTGGVLTQCGNEVDHCVQATGYANYGESGAYWIVRNSWGEDWGESGYIWVEIGQDLCSIGDYATVVTATTV